MSAAGSDITHRTFRAGREALMANILGQIYEAGHTTAGLRGVMDGVRNLFDGSRACLTRFVDGSTHSVQAVEDEEFLCDEALHAFRRDPFFSSTRRRPVGEAFLQDEITDSASFRRGELFSDWYAPRDMYSGLSANVKADSGSNWFLDVQRGQHQQAFEPADAQVLDVITSHLMRAWSLSARVKREGIETAISAMDEAIFVIDPGGRVETMNLNARTLLGRDGGTLRLGPMKHLAGIGHRETSRIRTLVKAAHDSELPQGCQLFLPTPSEAREPGEVLSGMLLRAIRFPAPEVSSSQKGSVFIAVRPISSGTGSGGLSDLVAREFGLTPAETRIAMTMATGQSLKDAASLAGISFNTARFHLRQVFAKTGTRQQSQLVALLRPL
jgi:DNA-binding CsgD family transcriptional regulator/PAS domain-containing protein